MVDVTIATFSNYWRYANVYAQGQVQAPHKHFGCDFAILVAIYSIFESIAIWHTIYSIFESIAFGNYIQYLVFFLRFIFFPAK